MLPAALAEDTRLTSPRPRSQRSLKAIFYENASTGLPPRTQRSRTRSPATPQSARSELSFSRPRTSPHNSHLQHNPPSVDVISIRSNDIKRDSGIAPSISTTDSHPPSLTTTSASRGTTAREPRLPTIVVHQDEEPPVARMNSFRGLDTKISALTADDINLGDLGSDKVTFSTRGSLLFGGKKMQELINAKGQEESRPYRTIEPQSISVEPPPPPPPPPPFKDDLELRKMDSPTLPASMPAPAAPPAHTVRHDKPKQGLVAGRRKPSVQMLQTAIQGGRVLSAEEITFSMKVRSMYEHGDERAAQWMSPLDEVLSDATSTTDRDTSVTPDSANGDLYIPRIRRAGSAYVLSGHDSAHKRNSGIAKEPNEVAGGIEDWDHIDSRNVDRYGFIHYDRPGSRFSIASSVERQGMPRIATSLRAEGARDRRLARGPSSKRSSRSLPAVDMRSETPIPRGPGSIHSVQSTSSRRNPFRSRTRRVLAEASDMLTLPPGLADIHEDEDAGRTASALKQREWAREEKWQRMARPVRHKGDPKGGGMRFEFDTTEAKLVERTWKGIPDRWRATAWHSFLSASARKRNSTTTDEELVGQFHKLQEMSSADDVQIDVDVPRTVNMHVMFRRRYRGGQRLLFRVLHAVSLYFPDTGYVQGMASLAATLLCYYDEEKAFVMMVRLWQLRGLEQLFQDGFAGLFTCLDDFSNQWLGKGDVSAKLEELNIPPTSYGTRWYLTLFNMSIPFPAQLRVWDVFMLLGDAPSNETGSFGGADLDVLHATSAALVDATREIILDSDFENAMKVLTSFVPIKDEDLLMRVAKTEYKMKKKRNGVKA